MPPLCFAPHCTDEGSVLVEPSYFQAIDATRDNGGLWPHTGRHTSAGTGPFARGISGGAARFGWDLIEPLAFLLAKYVKYPALGHPVLDEIVGNLRVTARGTADEAVERAANLVRYGDRSQLAILLGGAAFVGWLLARQNPNEILRDISPSG